MWSAPRRAVRRGATRATPSRPTPPIASRQTSRPRAMWKSFWLPTRPRVLQTRPGEYFARPGNTLRPKVSHHRDISSDGVRRVLRAEPKPVLRRKRPNKPGCARIPGVDLARHRARTESGRCAHLGMRTVREQFPRKSTRSRHRGEATAGR